MWEKRLNENYFKLFRKREERGKVKRKRLTKQETGKDHKGKGREKSVIPLVSSVVSVTISVKPRGSSREISWTREKVEEKMATSLRKRIFRS